MRFLISLLLLASASLLNAATDADTRFAAANAAFASGDFTKSANEYRTLIADGIRDPAVFFNLGNAEFRLGHQGPAALAYERALVLDPTHAESRQNLRFLTRKTGRLIDEASPFARFGQRFSENMTVLVLSASAWLLVLTLGACILLRPRSAPRGFLYTLAAFGFLGTALSGTVLAAQLLNAPARDRAVVVADEAKAHTAPALSAKEVIAVPPGSVLRVLSTRESWCYVALPGDLRGWVETKAIEAIDAIENKDAASTDALVAGT